MNTAKSDHRQGFTLIEILVAIAIFSILIAALYSTFFMAQKAMATVDESLLVLQESRGILDIFRKETEASFYSSEKKYSFFRIDDRDLYGKQASRISFTSFTSFMPGLSRISYSVEEAGGRLVLRKKVESAYAPSDDKKGIDLMEDIEAFTAEARYKDRWIKRWDSEQMQAVPEEVRLTVTVMPGNRKEKISFSDIARPRAGRVM